MRRVRVKICGITTPEGVDAAVENGADAIGFVFAVSPRRVDSRSAARLAWRVPALVNRVGVFDERALGVAELIREVPLCAVQAPASVLGMISEFTNPGSIIPMFRDGEDLGERLDRYVRDGRLSHAVLVEGARSGEGVRADWSRIAKAAIGVRVILAGGLTPDNVAEAIETVRPYAVDVSSGVESSPGIKDPLKVRDFLQAVRGVERSLV